MFFQGNNSNIFGPNFPLAQPDQQHEMDFSNIRGSKKETPNNANLFAHSSTKATASASFYTFSQSSFRSQGSPDSTQSIASKHKDGAPPLPDDQEQEDLQVLIKRQRNTMAARKYRQKRLDRIADLERALEETATERDELKLRLARKEAEVDALREMLSRN